MVDKLLRKNWVVKIISFVIALMLYAVVSAGQGSGSGSAAGLLANPVQQATFQQKLEAFYNANKYVVSGVPQQVSIRAEGSSNLLIKARLVSKSAYINLNGLKPGTYDVKVQTKGFPSGLSLKAEPKTVRVKIQKKVSKRFSVVIDEVHKSSTASDVSAALAVSPKTVTVTGGANTVDSIAVVKGVLDLKGETGSVNQTVTLHAYNSHGGIVSVSLDPAAVQVQLELSSYTKQFSLQAVTTGTPASGYTVGSVSLSSQYATVSAGSQTILKSIISLSPLSVSVNGLSSDKTYTVSVPLPETATLVSPSTVTVTVHITPASSDSSSTSLSSGSTVTRTFSDIPVKVTGGNATLVQNTVSIAVSGNADAVNSLSAGQISAVADVSTIGTGNSVAVEVSVPAGLQAVATPSPLNVKTT